ncbi:MAG: DNA repair exonuclease [Desulfobacterales bacterium]|jgi:DNA repair exonuclease SbcCD nuclease subunit
MVKFIHTADIHLDSPLHRLAAYEGAPVDEIRQASRRAFENLIDLAIAESVHFVLIAGDLFDGDWKDYHTGLYFTAQMHRLKAAQIPVYIVSGNHDAAGQMTRRLPYPDNVHIFDHSSPGTRVMENLKVAVHGQSFATPAVMDNLVFGYPDPLSGYFNIGLLHTSLTGREGHETYAPCAPDDLQTRGYDYWALGHVHQFEVVAHDPPMVFPGCIQGRHIRESGAKGAVVVTIREGSPPVITHYPCDVIRWSSLTVDIEGMRTRQACLDRFVEALAGEVRRHDPLPLIIRVTFGGETAAHGQIQGDLEYWEEAVRATAVAQFGDRVWVEKVRLATRGAARSPGTSIGPGPLRELEKLVAETLADNERLCALGDDLTGLFRKLPAEYRRGDDAIDLSDPDDLRQIVEQAHAMLVKGLKKETHGE